MHKNGMKDTGNQAVKGCLYGEVIASERWPESASFVISEYDAGYNNGSLGEQDATTASISSAVGERTPDKSGRCIQTRYT